MSKKNKEGVIKYTVDIFKGRLITFARIATFSEIGKAVNKICGGHRAGDKVIIEFIGSCGTRDPLDFGNDITIEKKRRK